MVLVTSGPLDGPSRARTERDAASPVSRPRGCRRPTPPAPPTPCAPTCSGCGRARRRPSARASRHRRPRRRPARSGRCREPPAHRGDRAPRRAERVRSAFRVGPRSTARRRPRRSPTCDGVAVGLDDRSRRPARALPGRRGIRSRQTGTVLHLRMIVPPAAARRRRRRAARPGLARLESHRAARRRPRPRRRRAPLRRRSRCRERAARRSCTPSASTSRARSRSSRSTSSSAVSAAASAAAVFGNDDDAVVWEEVEARTDDEVRLSATFLVFMTVATLIAAVGVVTDQPILIVGRDGGRPRLRAARRDRRRHRAPAAARRVAIDRRPCSSAIAVAIVVTIGFALAAAGDRRVPAGSARRASHPLTSSSGSPTRSATSSASSPASPGCCRSRRRSRVRSSAC